MQRALGHIHRGVLAAGGHRTVAAQVLRRGRKCGGGTKARSLEAAGLGRGKLRCEPGVLARTLDHPSPAWIAGDIQHRCERQADAVRGSLLRRRARGALPAVRIEQAGFRQRYGENRAMTVDDIETHQQRNAEARMLHREALQGMHLCTTPHVENVTDLPVADTLLQRAPRARTCDRARARGHVQLPDLLREGHAGEQSVGPSHAVALR